MSDDTRFVVTRSSLATTNVPRANIVAVMAFLSPIALGALASFLLWNPVSLIVGVILGFLAAQSPKVAKQWESAVVLRLGKYIGLRGPGLFWIIPFVDTIAAWVDQRVITTSFAAEETLTSDTVPVNVDAVLFWMVYDPEKAALEVQDYPQAVSWAAQTALRDILGRTFLTDLLRGRERIEEEPQKLIDERSNPWGVTVQSVEMRDEIIPAALQDAMSREAQCTRETSPHYPGPGGSGNREYVLHRIRIIPGQSHSFAPARHEHALRGFEREKGALMLVPSTAVESMGMGGLIGAAALRQRTLTGADELPENPQ